MKHYFIPTLFLLLFSLNSFSQFFCANPSFEDASLTTTIPGTLIIASQNAVNGWTITGGTNGNSCNLNACCATSPSNVQLIAPTITGYIDTNIGSSYPIFSQYGNPSSSTSNGDWFCKINDNIANSGVNKLSTTINVNPQNRFQRFKILPVFQNSSHNCCVSSIIKVIIRDAFTNSVIPNPQLSISSNSTCITSTCAGSVLNFSVCPSNSSFSYTGWQLFWLDLSAYIGNSLKFEITVADCAAGDHAGYCYFDMDCFDFGIDCYCPVTFNDIHSTCGSSTLPAIAPNGFASYLWSGPVGWPGNGATTQSVSMVPGTYTLSCNFPGSCTPFVKTFTVNSTPPANATLTSSQSTACAGGNTIALTGSPSGGVYTGSFVTGNTFNPYSAGNYSVAYTYTDTNGCSDTATKNINVITCATGINNLTTSNFNADLYPQPTKDFVNINLINSYNKNIEVRIIDITGKEIEKKELEVNQGKTQFSTSHLQNGIYILQLKNSQGQVAVKRLVVSR